MTQNEQHQPIGDIGNYYGRLVVKAEGGRYFWCIGNWSEDDWEEIPESLYRALVEYEASRTSKTQ